MKQILCGLLLALSAAGASAADPKMSASSFEAYTTGKTLFYGRNGSSYGAERYLPNRRVIWSFLDGECKDGSWYPQGENICFLYDDRPDDPQCWSFTQGPNGLIAQFDDGGQSSPLYEARDTGEEMVCLGPEVGV